MSTTDPKTRARDGAAESAVGLRAQIAAQLQRSAAVVAANQQAHAELLRSIVAGTAASVLQSDAAGDDATSLLAKPAAAQGDTAVAASPSWPELLAALRRVLAAVQQIEAGNARLRGSGTLEDPYVVSEGSLYVQAPIMIAFAGATPAKLKLAVHGGMLTATQ